MGVKKFIKDIANLLKIENIVTTSKKKSIKDIIKKLKKRRLENFEKLRDDSVYENHSEIEEEIKIITTQINKAEKILNRLNNKK